MQFIDRHKALLITSLLMGIVILSLYNINMVRKQQGNSEMMVEIPSELLEEVPEEEEDPLLEQQRDLIAARRTHDAFNEDFEDPEDDQAFEERLKALMGNTNAAEGSEGNESDGSDTETNDTDGEVENATPEKVVPQEEKESNNRNTSLSYRLKDRKALELPNPVYTCQGSGKVVVKIEVNESGYVIDTEINKKASTTRNECLFDNAIKYAKSALFDRSTRKQQLGTITYFFNYGG